MAQTKRSLSAIYALLADNATQDISETDLRDAIATVSHGHGEIYVSSSAATTVPDTSAWTQAAGTWTFNGDGWDMNTNGQLRYIGAPDRGVVIDCTFSITSSGSNKTYSFGFAKNGSILTPSIQQRKIGTGTDVGIGGLTGHIDVSTNDYITVVVRGDTDATNMTFDHCILLATDLEK